MQSQTSYELQADLRGAWLSIDLGAIRHNVRQLRAFLPKGTRIMAVVKADGYGHGALMTARTALEAGAEWLGVATVAEGLQLRSAGINCPILLLGLLVPDAYPAAIANGFHLTVADGREIRRIEAIATSLNQVANVNLKVDTGMTRVGALPSEVAGLISLVDSLPNIRLAGLSSHFAKSEEENEKNEKNDATKRQLSIFRELQRSLHLPASILLHTANSAATLFHPESHFDLVRPGLILYGVSPNSKRSLPFPLRPALSLKARITQLKTVPPGVPIGYSGTFVSSRLTTVALLPVGYADGLPRCLSNRQDVLVRGKRCPIIGNISMDQCAIDVTDVPVEVGEAVTLLGEGIGVEEWSETAKTIPYEIICGLGMRLPKVFENEIEVGPENPWL